MGNEPKALLIRLRDIMDWSGLEKAAVLQAVDAGVIKGIKLCENGRNVYNREQVRKALMLD